MIYVFVAIQMAWVLRPFVGSPLTWRHLAGMSDEDLRRSGAGRALMDAAEEWAREHGYAEIASDALLDNEVSHAAHRALGFEEVERSVHFRKAL